VAAVFAEASIKPMHDRCHGIRWLVRQRALYVAILVWLLVCGVVIYSILMPRYLKLFSPMTAYLPGAVFLRTESAE
jgi:hypothetical protein